VPNKEKTCGDAHRESLLKTGTSLDISERKLYSVTVSVGDKQFGLNYHKRVGANVNRAKTWNMLWLKSGRVFIKKRGGERGFIQR